jgi:site-specific DNA-cytosine methylase
MGLKDNFALPKNIKEAYQCTGDAVAPQAVEWINTHLLQQIVQGTPLTLANLEQLEFAF